MGTVTDPSNSAEEKEQILVDMEKLADRASDTLEEVIRDATWTHREQLKPVVEQDKAKINAAQKRVQIKSDMLKATCNL